MPVMDPGTFVVECDDCGVDQEFDSSEFAEEPNSWGVENSTLEEEGWVRKGGETFCPECAAKEENE